MNDTRIDVEQLSPEERRVLLAQLRDEETVEEQAYELSFGQESFWFLDQLGMGNAYNIPIILQFKGSLDVTALERALQEIVRRHQVLRTTYCEIDEQPRQVIHAEAAVRTLHRDLQLLPSDAQQAEVKRLSQEELLRPFDLAQDLMLRAMLLKLAVDKHVLLLTLHHIACDGGSIRILIQELTDLYAAFMEGKPSPLPELPIQYVDFARWQRQWLSGEVREHLLDYWKDQLTGIPQVHELPTDRPRPAKQTFRGGQESFAIDAALTRQLRMLGQQHGATLYMVLLTGFQVLLARYSQQADIVVASPVANRTRQELEPLIGFLTNTLVLRTDLSGNPAFTEALARVRAVAQAAYEHQSLSHNPLVQVLFVLQSAPMPLVDLPDLRITRQFPDAHTVRCDLEIYLWQTEDGLQGHCVYNTDLFDASTIRRMMAHFQILLYGLVDDPSRCISDVLLLTETERHQLVVTWNDTRVNFSQDKCIHQVFEEQAERTPDAVAVRFQGQQLTYRTLNAQANQLAHYLQRQGIRPEDCVGICMERSLEMVIGTLGILKAGGVCVPFDLAYPEERLAFMLEDARVRVFLTTQPLLAQLPEASQTQLFTQWEMLTDEPEHNPNSGVSPGNLLYCLYTSGSTGKPKGVTMPHRALCNLIGWQQTHTTVANTARTLQFAPVSFDVSFQELFSTLCTGGTLVLIEEAVRRDAYALLHTLEEQAIERLFLPFVSLRQLAEVAQGQMPTMLREIITAGEQLQITPSIANWFRETECILHNHYGPTESHVVTAYTLNDDVDNWPPLPPIGRPIANVQIYLLDDARQPVPVGVPGEVYIGGVCLARGYLNRPDLTAEKFIPNLFSEEPGARLYRTGDLARYRTDGTIEFLGRLDHQVKLRGFRIELGEIEAVLSQYPAVREAVVVGREDVPGDMRLAAYVVADQEPAPTSRDLRAFLQAKLPDYMVPSVFVELPELPLTPSGKIDRRALSTPKSSAPSAYFVPPRSATEKLLASIWCELLDLEKVGIHDNFFELGGHSLLATRVTSRIRQTFDVELTLQSLFINPTVASQAGELAQIGGGPEIIDEIARTWQEIDQLSAEQIDAILAQES